MLLLVRVRGIEIQPWTWCPDVAVPSLLCTAEVRGWHRCCVITHTDVAFLPGTTPSILLLSLLCRFGGLPAVADNALEAMGPVLESVLGSLTQEYEKRLLAKDHEVKAAQQQLATVRHELAEARELAAENARLLPAPEIHPGECFPAFELTLHTPNGNRISLDGVLPHHQTGQVYVRGGGETDPHTPPVRVVGSMIEEIDELHQQCRKGGRGRKDREILE